MFEVENAGNQDRSRVFTPSVPCDGYARSPIRRHLLDLAIHVLAKGSGTSSTIVLENSASHSARSGLAEFGFEVLRHRRIYFLSKTLPAQDDPPKISQPVSCSGQSVTRAKGTFSVGCSCTRL